MEAIKQMAKSQIKNANNINNKNITREQISNKKVVKRFATEDLKLVEYHIKKKEE